MAVVSPDIPASKECILKHCRINTMNLEPLLLLNTSPYINELRL